jgi:2-keto-4-pentenoate hydratase/2-oxohepta-3-ene-1,7-dioic acid hydratase in catechol pathway
MKLVTYRTGDGPSAVGILTDSGVLPTGHTDLVEVIRSGAKVEPTGEAIADATLLAPVPRPGKLLFCGVNYASHKEENPGAVLPDEPFFFAKLPTAVVGPDQPIRLPAPESEVDYEVELAVVIGKEGRGIAAADALDHVFGYTVVNDVSGRDVQFRDNQITLGKGFDTFSPMGPCVLTADEVPDPAALHVASHVNGEQRQGEPAANMRFPVPALIEYVSRHITLEPGDIVTTGTPAGVGAFRNPPAYLVPGDTVSVEVDAIGRLTNPVVAGWA